MKKKESLLINRFKSIVYAVNGFLLLLRSESSIKIQFIIALLLTFAGFYFNISSTEWLFQILSITLVMSIEGLNTAIEKLSDFVQPEYNKKIGLLKDISAGAVFIAALGAIAVGLVIYIPRVF